jgi:hypothetical protein
VAHPRPSVSLGVVVPPSQCPSLPEPDPIRDPPGPAQVSQVGHSARSGPCFPLPYKWAWRPMGTLDLTLLIPTSISDLTCASLLHLTSSAPRICQRPPPPTMDRNHRDDRDNWEGRPAPKRSFEETLPLEERRIDTLSESELCLLLERRARQGDRSPPRLLEAGRFEGKARVFSKAAHIQGLGTAVRPLASPGAKWFPASPSTGLRR